MNNDSRSEEFIDCVWNYGTWGYCVSLENENIFKRYTLLEQATEEDIMEFFNIINHIFVVKGELDEVWLISKFSAMDLESQLLEHNIKGN